jgi:hypothetical protein
MFVSGRKGFQRGGIFIISNYVMVMNNHFLNTVTFLFSKNTDFVLGALDSTNYWLIMQLGRSTELRFIPN